MKARVEVALVLAIASLAAATPASAHRLDEYLQATRLAIGVDRVSVHIDLTPGAHVASRVLGWIDANRDGALSRDEADAYARTVVRESVLDVDGAAAPLTVVGVEVPQPEAMRLGTGMVRIEAAAAISPAGGRHRVTFRNAHQPAVSVYLANALVPDDPRVRVGQQTRDRGQRELAVDYEVAGRSPQGGWWLPIGIGAIGLLVAGRRRSRRD